MYRNNDLANFKTIISANKRYSSQFNTCKTREKKILIHNGNRKDSWHASDTLHRRSYIFKTLYSNILYTLFQFDSSVFLGFIFFTRVLIIILVIIHQRSADEKTTIGQLKGGRRRAQSRRQNLDLSQCLRLPLG